MQSNVVLVELDEYIEESRWIKKGDIVIETFDLVGKLWPLIVNSNYLVDLELAQLDFEDPEVIAKYSTYESRDISKEKAEQIDNTFAYYLYGHVKHNKLHVGDFVFDFSRFNDYCQYEKSFVKVKVDRIYIDFIKELS